MRALRERFDPAAALGVPAHVTILIPFMPPEKITAQVLARAKAALKELSSFSFVLDKVGRWPETTYLIPDPATPFVQMTKALAAAFPDYPPYGGKHAGVAPHLTVADRSTAHADEAERELRAVLARRDPIRSTCRKVDLYENAAGAWKPMHAIALEDLES